MSKLMRFSVFLWVLASLLLVQTGSVAAQGGGTAQYFADTGHSVSGDFLLYYQSVPNAAQVFGSPITEQFADVQTGRTIQYFQRVRFEFYPENQYGQRVRLSPLGEYVYQRSPANTKMDFVPTFGCRYSETGFYICYDFLDFYDKNGGEAIFGKPKSGFEFYNGRIVQYFERARFDWYPEYSTGQKVVLAQLGRVYFDLVPEDANRLQSFKPDLTTNNSASVLALNTKAFTWKAVTQLNDTQSVYVVVQDQTLRAVPGAMTIITIYWPAGGAESVSKTTNGYGVATYQFAVKGQPYGSVITIQAEVLYQGLSSKTVTSFRVWQ
jgi:hypothetical protein